MYSSHYVIRCLTIAGSAFTLFAATLTQQARAQTDVIPKEVIALFDDINDIDKLRVLNPLKLTSEQLDKLITSMKKATDDYNRKLADAVVPPLRALASDIKDARAKML